VLFELGEWLTGALFYGVVMGDRMSIASGFAATLTAKAGPKLLTARRTLGDDEFDRQVANGGTISSNQIVAIATQELDKIIARRGAANAGTASSEPPEPALREQNA